MTTFQNFHEGEAQLQAEDGVDTATFDALVDQPVEPALNPNEVNFVNKRTFSVAGSLDAEGRPWASPLYGPGPAQYRLLDWPHCAPNGSGVDRSLTSRRRVTPPERS